MTSQDGAVVLDAIVVPVTNNAGNSNFATWKCICKGFFYFYVFLTLIAAFPLCLIAVVFSGGTQEEGSTDIPPSKQCTGVYMGVYFSGPFALIGMAALICYFTHRFYQSVNSTYSKPMWVVTFHATWTL